MSTLFPKAQRVDGDRPGGGDLELEGLGRSRQLDRGQREASAALFGARLAAREALGQIPGERVFIEIRGTTLPRLTLDEVCHFDRPLFAVEEDGGSNGNGVFGCHLDAMCEPGSRSTCKCAMGLNSEFGPRTFGNSRPDR